MHTRNTCASCQHYSAPGHWSARCKLGPPSFMRPCPDHPAYSIVRADNSCGRFVACVEAIAETERKAA